MKDDFRLDGKVAVVTGASSGLGAAFAQALAVAGAHVALTGRRAERLAETASVVESEGRRAVVIPGDVSDPDACQRAIDQTMTALGRVDILVNNAGVGTATPATRESPDEFREVIEINLAGSYWMAQACGRIMLPGSSIINVSSVLALMSAGLPQAAYSASKAGLHGLTRDLAAQWSGRKGIRVNAVAPGFFATEMTEHYAPGYLDEVVARVPMGRTGELREAANVIVFLASDAASYVTGIVLPVDGGFLVV
jgi:NAD(P)-dependent dehydrogenase (short-subunit alcohol dehydrogenase family)